MKYLCFEKERQECYLIYGVKPPVELEQTMDIFPVEEVPSKEGHSTVITRDEKDNISYDFKPMPKTEEEIQSERLLQLELAMANLMGMEEL